MSKAFFNIQSNLCNTATQKRQTKILMTNGSLMKVESIAECSPRRILQYNDLHKAIIGLENQFVVFLRVALLDGFYCRDKAI